MRLPKLKHMLANPDEFLSKLNYRIRLYYKFTTITQLCTLK